LTLCWRILYVTVRQRQTFLIRLTSDEKHFSLHNFSTLCLTAFFDLYKTRQRAVSNMNRCFDTRGSHHTYIYIYMMPSGRVISKQWAARHCHA
jgi:hypothetical protein